MIGTATKKPVMINFCLWTGENLDEVMKFCAGNATYELMFRGNSEIVIQTLEDGLDKIAQHVASKGDYIIQGVQGEFYPCKPDIFEATYLIAAAPQPPAGQQDSDHVANVGNMVQQDRGEACPNCDGEGSVLVYSNHGPDSYEMAVDCPHCEGGQTLFLAYHGAVKRIAEAEEKYLKAGSIIWGWTNRDQVNAIKHRLTEIAKQIRPDTLDWLRDRLKDLAESATDHLAATSGEAIAAQGAIPQLLSTCTKEALEKLDDKHHALLWARGLIAPIYTDLVQFEPYWTEFHWWSCLHYPHRGEPCHSGAWGVDPIPMENIMRLEATHWLPRPPAPAAPGGNGEATS